MYEKKNFVNEFLHNNNIDTLLVWRSCELVRLSGYQPQWGLSLGLYSKNKNPTLMIPALEPDFLLPNEAEIIKFPWGKLIPDNPWDKCFDHIKDHIKKENIKRIGIFQNTPSTSLFGNHGEMPPLPTDFIERILSLDCEIVNLDNKNPEFYHIKTEEDVEKILRTHQVAKVAVQAFYNALQVGETEAGVSAKIESAVQSQNGKYGDLTYYSWAYVQSGKNTTKGGTYGRTGSRVLQKHDPVLVELAVCVGGFWADITRTGFVESPTEQHKELYDLVASSQEQAMSILKPGVIASDIDAKARNFLTEQGVGEYFTHAVGHHVGYKYHEPTGISPYGDSILKEGMIITVEPGIYIDKYNVGIRIEDNVLITKNGYKLLSDYK